MPQLNIATFPSQIFWLAISFSFLYFVCSRYVLPNIKQVLKERHIYAEGEISRANNAKEKARKVEADYIKALELAKEEAVSMVAETREEVKNALASHDAKIDAEIAKMQEQSDKEFEEFKVEMLQELKLVALDYSRDVISKLINIDADKTKLESSLKQNNL